MNIQVLKKQHAEVTTRAQNMFRRFKQQAKDERMPITESQMDDVDRLVAEAAQIEAQIDRAEGDQAMLSQIDRITGSATRRVHAGGGPAIGGSIGDQLFGEGAPFREWLESSKGRRPRQFSSGVFEVSLHPSAETLTTESGSPSSGGALIVPTYVPGIVEGPTRALGVADLFSQGQTDSNSIIYMLESLFDAAAEVVPEGELKPESSLRFRQETDPVVTIATWLPASVQMLDDNQAIRAYVEARLRLAVQLAEEDQVLNGDASPTTMTGILNRAGLAAPIVSGTPSGETDADALMRQIGAIQTSSGFSPDAIVIHPDNWGTLQLMKTADGAYVGGGPFARPAVPTMWGLKVVVSEYVPTGSALVGAFAAGGQLFRKGGLRFEVSNSHSDYFVRNLVALRMEVFSALVVYRPAAFGLVTGLS